VLALNVAPLLGYTELFMAWSIFIC
jgi:hypothetical protein